MKEKIKVLFFGTPEFAAKGLAALLNSEAYQVLAVVTQPDKPAGRGKKLQASAVKLLALQHGLTVIQPASIKKELPSFLANCQALGTIDIGVVIAFGQILPAAVLTTPRLGCINVHASLLPRWRGAAPIQRAIMNADKETGVQLMQMELGLDTGPVFATAKTEILNTDNAGTLHDRLADLGARLLVDNLSLIVSGQIKGLAQEEAKACYAAKILNTESKIDWTKSATEIDCLIRGLTPFPGAFTMWAGKRLKILSCKIISDARQPRQVAKIIVGHKNGVEIICGQDNLLLELIQPEGKKVMLASDFVKGNPVPNSGLLDTD